MSPRRGFTLLEVLVAISILGLSLTAILSAQTGLFASLMLTEHMSTAPGLVRCKMSELEIKMSKEGFPLLDVQDEGNCCADETLKGYKCKWKVLKVLLPPPPGSGALSATLSGTASGLAPLAAMATLGNPGASNALGSTSSMKDVGSFFGNGPAGGIAGIVAPGAAPGLGGVGGSPGLTPFGDPNAPAPSGAAPASSGSLVGGNSPMGQLGTITNGAPPSAGAMLAPLVMSFVYPKLKPMLEASIRKVTVGVYWKEGTKDRDLVVEQFVTNPQQGQLDPNAAAGLAGIAGALGGVLGGATGGGATPAPPPPMNVR